MKLDTKVKRIIKKDNSRTCGYIYRDGICVNTREEHTYKGERFSKEIPYIFRGEIPISYSNGHHEERFKGRIVVHNPSLLLDGVKRIHIFLNNKSTKMEEMNITCNTITLETESGLKIHEDMFTFLSSEFTIQDDSKQTVESWKTGS